MPRLSIAHEERRTRAAELKEQAAAKKAAERQKSATSDEVTEPAITSVSTA
jgi:hypothetical protein